MIALTQLFDATLRLGDFPALWSDGIIVRKIDWMLLIIAESSFPVARENLHKNIDSPYRLDNYMNQCGYKQITPMLSHGSAVLGIARHSQFDIFRRPTRITKYQDNS